MGSERLHFSHQSPQIQGRLNTGPSKENVLLKIQHTSKISRCVAGSAKAAQGLARWHYKQKWICLLCGCLVTGCVFTTVMRLRVVWFATTVRLGMVATDVVFALLFSDVVRRPGDQ